MFATSPLGRVVRHNTAIIQRLDPCFPTGFENGSVQLFNLKDDIGETTNLKDQHPEIVKELESILANVRTPSEVFTFGSIGYLQDK